MGVLHLILRYTDSLYNVDTLSEHINMINSKGKVAWGIIRQNPERAGISQEKADILKKQLQQNIRTFAFMVTNGKITAIGEVVGVLIDKEDVLRNSDIIPEYYRNDLYRCRTAIVFSKMIKINKNITDLLRKYNLENIQNCFKLYNSDKSVTLMNQANPLYVEFKSDSDYISLQKFFNEFYHEKDYIPENYRNNSFLNYVEVKPHKSTERNNYTNKKKLENIYCLLRSI